MKVIGLDVGATNIKSAVLDLDKGKVDAVLYTPFPPFRPNDDPRIKEVDLDLLTKELFYHLEQREPAPVFICNQTGGWIEVKGRIEDTQRFVSWMDGRCTAYRPHQHQRKVGTSWTVSFGAWIAWRISDPTLMHWRGIYHETQLFEAFEPSSNHRVRLVGKIGESRGHPIYTPVGDHACAVHGVELGPDELSINIGTGCQVSMLDLGWGEGPRLHQQRPGIDGDLMCVTHLPGGAWNSTRLKATWIAHAATRLRPFKRIKYSGGFCENRLEMVMPNISDQFGFPSSSSVRGEHWELVENATFKGLLRLAKEVLG